MIYHAVLFMAAIQVTSPNPLTTVETWEADSKTAAIAACELLKPDRVAGLEERDDVKAVVISRCFWTRKND